MGLFDRSSSTVNNEQFITNEENVLSEVDGMGFAGVEGDITITDSGAIALAGRLGSRALSTAEVMNREISHNNLATLQALSSLGLRQNQLALATAGALAESAIEQTSAASESSTNAILSALDKEQIETRTETAELIDTAIRFGVIALVAVAALYFLVRK